MRLLICPSASCRSEYPFLLNSINWFYRLPTIHMNVRIQIRAIGLFCCLLLTHWAFSQTTRYVSTTGITPAASATSWAASTTSLQGAIDYVAANGGGQVWVAAGVYKPTTGTDRNISFSMRNGVAIYGGFAGNETSLGSRPDMNPITGNPASSTLSGEINNDGLFYGNTTHIFYHPSGTNLNNTAILDGFCITRANDGAIYNRAGNSPVIRNCVLTDNYADGQGAALYNSGSNPTLTNCLLQNNSSDDGGAIYNDGSSPTLTNCRLQNNDGSGRGGAICNIASNPTLTDCLLQTNRSREGGAIFNRGSSPTLINCSLLNNGNNGGGSIGGAFYTEGGSPALTNCTLRGNNSGDGGAFYNVANSSLRLTGCTLEDNSAGTTGLGGAFSSQSSSITLTSCILRNHTAAQGGVFYTNNSNIILTNCTIEKNHSLQGGVFYNRGGNTRLTDCTLKTNDAGNGGVFFNYGSSPTLTGCTLKDNTAENGGVFLNVNSSPVLMNCLLENNQASRSGGVINCEGSSNFVLTNCILLNNRTSGQGGAFYCNEGNPELKDCLLQNNRAYQGGVFYSGGGNLRLTDCRLQSNTATQGGAFYCDSSAPELTNCVVSDNTAQSGGGFYLYTNSNVNLINCTLQNNQASTQGGAFYNEYTSNPNLINCSLQGNTAPTGRAFYNDDSTPTLVNCVLWNHGGSQAVSNLNSSSLTITYSLFEPSLAAIADVNVSGPGNLTTTISPFVSATSAALLPASPAIDQANSTTYAAAGGPQTDVAGNPRLVGTSCQLDMGAAEFQQTGAGINTSVQITTQPPSASVVCAGSTVPVAVSVTGTATYQWYLAGTSGGPAPILSQTATTLSLTNVQSADQGSYSLVATGGCNSATSTAFSLTVNPVPSVSVSALSNQLNCTNTNLTLTATASTTALLWSTGQTTTTISVSQTGGYSVTATGANGCSAVSNNLPVTENFSLPPFTIASATVCPGQTINLTASGCGGQILWSTGATTAMITLTAGSSTSLLTATCTLGVCSTTASGQVVVGGIQPPPAQILSFTADESVCPVRLTGRGVATSFTMTGPKDYVFSTVYREGAMHDTVGLNVKQAGTYTLTATYTNSCGTSEPVTRTVTVGRNCP